MINGPLPPGSYGWPLIGETLGWLRDPESWVKDHLRRYGPIFKTRVLGKKVFVMLGPEANEFILWSHRDHFEWGGGYQAFAGGLFPNSLSTEDGDLHDRHRSALIPSFRSKVVDGYFPLVRDMVSARIEQWGRRPEITAFDECRNLTLSIVSRVIIGDVSPAQMKKLASDFESLSRGLLTPFKWDLPGTTYGRALKARRSIETWIRDELRRPHHPDDTSLLASLKPDADGEKTSLTVAEIVPQVLGLLFDGQDTTGSLMTWMLLELAAHPDVLERLQAEVPDDSVTGGTDWGQLNKVRYLDAVVQEVSRLHHPAPALPRKVTAAFEFKGFHVPEGSLVLYSPAASHRMPEAFDSPDEFQPDRFLPPRDEHRRNPFGLVTFGGGPRACLGAPLAMMELKVFASALARTSEWEVLPGQDLRPRFFSTKRPRSGLRLRVTRRGQETHTPA